MSQAPWSCMTYRLLAMREFVQTLPEKSVAAHQLKRLRMRLDAVQIAIDLP